MRESAATDDDQAELEEVTADELLTTVIPVTWKGSSPEVIAKAPTSCSERSCSPRSGPMRPSLRHRPSLVRFGGTRASAQLLVADGEQLAAHLVETERIRAHAMLDDARRAELSSRATSRRGRNSRPARARLRDTFEAELDRLLAAISNRPDAHEIDLTDPTRWGAWCGAVRTAPRHGTERPDRSGRPSSGSEEPIGRSSR